MVGEAARDVVAAVAVTCASVRAYQFACPLDQPASDIRRTSANHSQWHAPWRWWPKVAAAVGPRQLSD